MKRALRYGGIGAILLLALGGVALSRQRVLASAGGPTHFAPVAAAQLRQVFPGGEDAFLLHPDRFELVSLSPHENMCQTEDKSCFHTFPVLGRAEVKNAAQRVAALYESVRPRPRSDKLKDIGLGCFMARHGLHLVKGSQALDLVICFQCSQMQITRSQTTRSGKMRFLDPRNVHLRSEGRATFEAAVKAAGLPAPAGYAS